MSTPGNIIPIVYDPDQPEDTPGESVSITYQIEPETAAKLSYDGTMISGRPRRCFINIDLGGSSSAMNVIDKDIPPYPVTFDITRGLSDSNVDVSAWMNEPRVKESLAIAVGQVIDLYRSTQQASQAPSETSSQLMNGPGESLDNSASGSIGFSGILSTLVGALRAPSK